MGSVVAVCEEKLEKQGVEFWQCNNRSKNHGVKGCASENLRMKPCLRGLSQPVEPDCCGKRTISSKWEKKEEGRKSVRKTSCGTNDRIDVATASYKDVTRTWTDGFGKGNCTGERNNGDSLLDGTEIKVRI